MTSTPENDPQAHDREGSPLDEKPEADVSEQERSAGPDDEPGSSRSHDPEAPEADALEQQAATRPHGDQAVNQGLREADEADLLDQARDADPDDDDER